MNFVLKNREALSERHYVRKADPDNNYWIDFSAAPLDKYVSRFGDGFCLVIAGDPDVEGDFFTIPYSYVADLLIESTQTKDKKGRSRWIGNVINFGLRIANTGTRRDISEFYGRPEQLNAADELPIDAETYDNEYAIQNRRTEVYQRLKQSAFRARVLKNFESQCCVTGIADAELLVASHIIPWARRVDTRLDPANGLCLSAWIDRLFDLGYISFSDDLFILTSDRPCSDALVPILASLSGQQATHPRTVPIKSEYLEWHRQHVFRTVESNRVPAT